MTASGIFGQRMSIRRSAVYFCGEKKNLANVLRGHPVVLHDLFNFSAAERFPSSKTQSAAVSSNTRTFNHSSFITLRIKTKNTKCTLRSATEHFVSFCIFFFFFCHIHMAAVLHRIRYTQTTIFVGQPKYTPLFCQTRIAFQNRTAIERKA